MWIPAFTISNIRAVLGHPIVGLGEVALDISLRRIVQRRGIDQHVLGVEPEARGRRTRPSWSTCPSGRTGWSTASKSPYSSLSGRMGKSTKKGVFAGPEPIRFDAKDVLVNPPTLDDTAKMTSSATSPSPTIGCRTARMLLMVKGRNHMTDSVALSWQLRERPGLTNRRVHG